MKKITLGIITLLIVCFCISCSNSKFKNNNIAKEVTITEIQQSINRNDAQVLIALGDNFDDKKHLIQSSELNADGLIALCANPVPMELDNTIVQNWFAEAIERTELTQEQQIQIAKLGEYAYTKALLLSSNLTADCLVVICENPKNLNLYNTTIQSWFVEAVERTELTQEQQVQIAKLGEYAYTKALLLSSNLTAEALVAICENPGSLNLNNTIVQQWFKEAIERTELTQEQQLKIANSKIKVMGLY